VLGAVIFLVYSLVNTSEDTDRQIVIDDDKLEHINALWEIQWKRPATPEELRSLVENYIRQEVFYREALRMNLDHNDEVVKRRLSQKMEFMTADLTKMVEPATDAKLKDYFETHQNDYIIPTAYSFNHILISTQKHENPQDYAAALLSNAQVEELDVLRTKGDQTLLPLEFEHASKADILRELGEDFYNELGALPPNKWSGPISSGFGTHLVYITAKDDSRIPKLAEVKDKVLRDFEYNKELTTKEAIYEEMKKSYKVIISSETLNSGQKDA
jgi:hypothetical protein